MDDFERRLIDLEGRADLEDDWRKIVNPPVARLLYDQAYADRKRRDRDRAWKLWVARIAVATGTLGILAGLVQAAQWALLVFHMR